MEFNIPFWSDCVECEFIPHIILYAFLVCSQTTDMEELLLATLGAIHNLSFYQVNAVCARFGIPLSLSLVSYIHKPIDDLPEKSINPNTFCCVVVACLNTTGHGGERAASQGDHRTSICGQHGRSSS